MWPLLVIDVLVVGVAAFLTAILSAVAGLGGGMILLLVIAQFVAPTVAIPIQGAIQLVSNTSRAALLRTNIAWPVVGWASILLLPAAFLGVAVATWLPEDAIRVALAAFVLVFAWRPQVLKRVGATADHQTKTRRMLVGVGALSGFLNSTVGASGPMTSPFYKAVTATHVAFVATAAMAQVGAHIAKLIAFSASGWSIGDHVPFIAVGIGGVLVGSFVGTRLLTRVPDRGLDLIFKVVLTVLALRLVYSVLR